MKMRYQINYGKKASHRKEIHSRCLNKNGKTISIVVQFRHIRTRLPKKKLLNFQWLWFFSFWKNEMKWNETKSIHRFSIKILRFKSISPDCPDNHHINLWTLLLWCEPPRHHRRTSADRCRMHNNKRYTHTHRVAIVFEWRAKFHKKRCDVKICWNYDRKIWYIKWAEWMAPSKEGRDSFVIERPCDRSIYAIIWRILGIKANNNNNNNIGCEVVFFFK